ncbi:MAG: type IV secretion system DNA-binding domain-containing protein [Methylacidiphilaceae bacterium]|nr:type IV secretion system DNA-binding domain-containing protein [Candidatus Methylacidiphilaceae bacterium]
MDFDLSEFIQNLPAWIEWAAYKAAAEPEWLVLFVGLVLGVPLFVPAAARSLWHRLVRPASLRLGGVSWTRRELCCGVFLVGGRGTGKTSSGIRGIIKGLLGGPDANFGALVLDQKGDEYAWYKSFFAAHGRGADVIPLRLDADSTESVNVFGDSAIPDETYIKWLWDAGKAHGLATQHEYFGPEALVTIQAVRAGLRALGKPASFSAVLAQLQDHQTLTNLAKSLVSTKQGDLPVFNQLVGMAKAPEQLMGILGTVKTMLKWYADPLVERVCFAEAPTQDLSALDQGKVFVLSVPERYEIQRRLLATLLKTWFYHHAMSRYDLPTQDRYKRRLLLLVADEYQEVVTGADSAHADHRDLALIRDTGCAVVAGTQLYSSVVATLGNQDRAKTVLGNFGSWLIYRPGDPDTAQFCSSLLGVKKERKITHGRQGQSWTEEEKPTWPADKLFRLPNFTCLIKHESGAQPVRARLERVK